MACVAKPSQVIRCVMVSKAGKGKSLVGFFPSEPPTNSCLGAGHRHGVSVVGDVALCALIQGKG
jgi:hypothetical protein